MSPKSPGARESQDPLTVSMFVYRCYLFRDVLFEEGIGFGRWARAQQGKARVPNQGTYMDWLNCLIGWQSAGRPTWDGGFANPPVQIPAPTPVPDPGTDA